MMPSRTVIPISLLALCLLSVPSLLPLVSADPLNVTVDDTYGDTFTGNKIIYSPQGSWTAGQTCGRCIARPDPSRAYNGTWHDSTYDPSKGHQGAEVPELSATVPFNGVAVYVYCILAGTSSRPNGYSNLTFWLDGARVSSYVHAPDGDTAYRYDVLVYANTTLPAGPHELRIVNSAQGERKSLVLLDYVVYTSVRSSVLSLGSQRAPEADGRVVGARHRRADEGDGGEAAAHAHGSYPKSARIDTSTPGDPYSSSADSVGTTLAPARPTAIVTTETVVDTVVVPPSPTPPSAATQSNDARGTSRNTVLGATLGSIFGAVVLAAVIGGAIRLVKRRRRRRIAPSTAYLQSAAAAAAAKEGSEESGGPPAMGVGATGKGALARGWGKGESPTTPMSVSTLAPLRPSSFGARGVQAGDPEKLESGIPDMSRRQSGW